MLKKRLVLIQYLLISVLLTINAQTEGPKPYFFIHLTDPQFGMLEADSGFAGESELYSRAVREINRLKPDFVVLTGDLVNNKDVREQIVEFKRITAGINKRIPVFYSPGNHDIGQSPSEADIDSFISEYGHDRFAFRHRRSLFIGINSCLIKADTPELEQKQYEWLEEVLSGAKRARHIIIFSHYPFFINDFREPETYSNLPVKAREKYFSLFTVKKVDMILAGHLHRNATAESGGIRMVTTGAVGKPLGKDPSGLRILKVYGDRIESNFYSIDSVPVSVGFD